MRLLKDVTAAKKNKLELVEEGSLLLYILGFKAGFPMSLHQQCLLVLCVSGGSPFLASLHAHLSV